MSNQGEVGKREERNKLLRNLNVLITLKSFHDFFRGAKARIRTWVAVRRLFYRQVRLTTPSPWLIQ